MVRGVVILKRPCPACLLLISTSKGTTEGASRTPMGAVIPRRQCQTCLQATRTSRLDHHACRHQTHTGRTFLEGDSWRAATPRRRCQACRQQTCTTKTYTVGGSQTARALGMASHPLFQALEVVEALPWGRQAQGPFPWAVAASPAACQRTEVAP